MATRHVLAELAAGAEAAGLPAVEIESVGGVDASARVAAGEAFDLVFLASDALGALADGGHIDAATITPLLRSQVAVAVASGAPGVPAERVTGAAFPDAGGVRAALRAAPRIGYSTGPSGTALVRLVEQWGLASELADRLVQARPGVPVARSVAEGEVDLGFQQLSELVGQPGIQILGVLPEDCAIDTVFAGAVATASGDPRAAAEILVFFRAAPRRAAAAAHSFVAL